MNSKTYKEPVKRAELARRSHYWFFNIFFNHYVRYETAAFQKEIFAITEDESIKLAVIVAFRGSAKSTIMTLSYPLWAILGKQQKKFVLILSKTQNQVKIHFANLKQELESNELLKADLGPFTQNEEWGAFSIVLPKYGARITAASSEQSIRGFRHGNYRPDLIICDDVEDLLSVKTLESRDKIDQWLRGEVIPGGDKNTKVIIVGNLLHEDSVLKRLKKSIDDGWLNGIFREYPLLDADGKIAWPGKFPDLKAIEELKKTIGSEPAWQREYLLKIIVSEEQLIRPEWIKYYDAVPDLRLSSYRYAATGIDLAISENQAADRTAMVSARIFGRREDLQIYILPNPTNEHLNFPQTIERAKLISKSLGNGVPTKLFVENVGYQQAVIDQLKKESFPAKEFKPYGQDKRARLSIVSPLIQSGKVLFPKQGAEELINQLLGFGTERYDDLVDAFAILVLKIIEDDKPGVTFPSPNYEPKPGGPQNEKEADLAAALESEYERSNFNRMMRERLRQSRGW